MVSHPFSRDLAGVRKTHAIQVNRQPQLSLTHRHTYTYTYTNHRTQSSALDTKSCLFYYNISLFDRMLCDQTTGSFNKQNVLACEHRLASVLCSFVGLLLFVTVTELLLRVCILTFCSCFCFHWFRLWCVYVEILHLRFIRNTAHSILVCVSFHHTMPLFGC